MPFLVCKTTAPISCDQEVELKKRFGQEGSIPFWPKAGKALALAGPCAFRPPYRNRYSSSFALRTKCQFDGWALSAG